MHCGYVCIAQSSLCFLQIVINILFTDFAFYYLLSIIIIPVNLFLWATSHTLIVKLCQPVFCCLVHFLFCFENLVFKVLSVFTSPLCPFCHHELSTVQHGGV